MQKLPPPWKDITGLDMCMTYYLFFSCAQSDNSLFLISETVYQEANSLAKTVLLKFFFFLKFRHLSTIPHNKDPNSPVVNLYYNSVACSIDQCRTHSIHVAEQEI